MMAAGSVFADERRTSQHYRCWLLALWGAALALRMLWVLVVDPNPKLGGGDGPFYLHLGDQLARGNGLNWGGKPAATVGPLYPAFLALMQILAGSDNVVMAARIGQAFIGSLMVLIVFAIGRLWRGPLVGLVAAGVLALDLRFIVETGAIYAETLFTAGLLLSLLIYFVALDRGRLRWWLLLGGVLSLTSLTRAVGLLLPVVLLFHMGITRSWKFALRLGLLMGTAALLVLVPWVLRNWVIFGSPRISEGAAAHLWLGATGDGQWTSNDQMLEDIVPIRVSDGETGVNYNYLSGAVDAIASDPWGWAALRFRRLLGAYAQPDGTVILGDKWGDAALKSAAWALVTGRGSLAHLIAVPAFWPKSVVYIMHFGSLALALLYVVTRWRAWREWALPVLVIAYFSGVYGVLTVIPRYLSPIMPLFLLLAAAHLVWLWKRRQGERLPN